MSDADPDRAHNRWFLPALVVGWLIIGWGISRAIVDAHDAKPFTVAAFVVAFDLLHDVVLVPLLLAGGWLIGRIVPGPARSAVRRAATAVSLLVVLFAAPLIGRFGRRPTNSSILPLPYVRNTLIVVAGIWFVTAVVVVRRTRRAATRRPAAAPRTP